MIKCNKTDLNKLFHSFVKSFFNRNFYHLIFHPFNRICIECVHVASEEGDYSYKKILNLEESAPSVCGLYIVTDPDKIVEISIKYLDASCDSGALLAVKINTK